MKENNSKYRKQKFENASKMARRKSRTCMNMESNKSDEFMELSITALGGQEDKDKAEKKIMKNILKEVIINK
jgi:hypothetical protein